MSSLLRWALPMSDWRYVHMPKTGGHSVREAMRANGNPVPYGHKPAHAIAKKYEGRLFGTLRPPKDWYRSFFGHCTNTSNKRLTEALLTYGKGAADWNCVLYGLLHPTVETLPFHGDKLFAPAGGKLWPDGGLYTMHVIHYYRGGHNAEHYGWRVEKLVDTRTLGRGLACLGLALADHVPRVNASKRLPDWPDNYEPNGTFDLPEEDQRMWDEAQEIMV